MIKHPKQTFGIHEDGHTIRIVHLTRDKDQVILMGLDRLELDNPLYRVHDNGSPAVDYEKSLREKDQQDGELKLDEFDSEFVSDFKLSPMDAMLNGLDLKNGVIAINVNDDNIHKASEFLANNSAVKRYAKNFLGAGVVKAGDWQSSSVAIANSKQVWIHYGANMLLELLQDYRKKNRIQLYYQLADASDIAITDYFRITGLHEDQRTFLIYLGQDYRKVFVFDHGLWQATLPLQISQKDPDMDIIYSKLSLALDSAQQQDPQRIVLCGDLATRELAENLHLQYNGVSVEMLSFSQLLVETEKAELYDSTYLAQYALPIALAYKALFPDEPRYTPSNFLPAHIIEGQKVFKIAWHGFIVLGLIFIMVLVATVAILKANQIINTEKIRKRELAFTLEVKRKEAEEIQRIRADLENQEKVIDVLRTLLEGKNPWTEILNTGNRIFANQPLSWLTNLQKEKDRFFITGVTTRRRAIIEFANSYTNAQIRKVTYAKIRDVSTWTFEILADFPVVDWIGEIERDLEALREMKKGYGEEDVNTSPSEATKEEYTGPVTPIAPQAKSDKQQLDKRGRIILSPLPQSSCPVPEEKMLTQDTADVQDYNRFILAINKDNSWDYRDLGTKFIAKHAKSDLVNAVRWWMSYRMYLDKEYSFATKFLDPILKMSDRYYPYALLLQARVSYATGNDKYKDIYARLKNDFGRHPLKTQIKADLDEIGKGGAK